MYVYTYIIQSQDRIRECQIRLYECLRTLNGNRSEMFVRYEKRDKRKHTYHINKPYFLKISFTLHTAYAGQAGGI